MADRVKRDRAIERMLKTGAAVPRRSVASDACIDGETLGAWSSGALAGADAARVESHLADCAHCQAMLAAFVRTEPVAVPSAPWWTRAHVRWLVPLATAATVAAIWVAVPSREEPRPPATVLLERAEPQPGTRPTGTPASGAEPQAPPADQSPAMRRDESDVQNNPARRESAERRSRAAQRPDSPRATDADRPDRKQAAAARRERGVEPAQQASKPEPQDQREERREAGAGARERTAAERTPATPPPVSSPAPAAESAAAVPERPLSRSAVTEIVSAGGDTRWRIVSGKVERSVTQGTSWESVPLPAPATILAGHAPSGSVVWLAGTSGALFLTVSGADFQQVRFVSSADLVSIVAIDDRQATVTTADGRRFRTRDGGRSWSVLPQ